MKSSSRLLSVSIVLSTSLIGTYDGAAATSASPQSQRGTIAAHLTSVRFPVSKATTVKLVYSFSSTSRRFGYVLSRKTGTSWVTVRRVDKRGTFTGTYRRTVTRLFDPKPVRPGDYRIKVSSSANTVTLRFTITRSATIPQAGGWVSTSLTGPVSGSAGGGSVTATRIGFTVLSGQTKVSAFGFGYGYSGAPKPGQSCSGSGYSAISSGATSPITTGQFSTPNPTGSWSGAGSGTFHGVFDSATTAHGTAQLQVYVGDPGCFLSSTPQTGTFTWTATRRS